jgi:hypothetical protein
MRWRKGDFVVARACASERTPAGARNDPNRSSARHLLNVQKGTLLRECSIMTVGTKREPLGLKRREISPGDENASIGVDFRDA